MFWDRDSDGVIWPWDTYVGFRDLGFNILFSFAAVLIINLNFSYPTRLAHSYLPDPFFRVYVDSIHKAKVNTFRVKTHTSSIALTGKIAWLRLGHLRQGRTLRTPGI